MTSVGTAEAVPVGDASVDVVVAGQAAHWFDPAPAAREIRRVLRPGGTLGLIWNTRDERIPWVGALGDLIAAESRGHEADQGAVDRFAGELSADVDVLDSGIVQPVTPEHVVAGIATRGRELLELPYVTRAYRLTPG